MSGPSPPQPVQGHHGWTDTAHRRPTPDPPPTPSGDGPHLRQDSLSSCPAPAGCGRPWASAPPRVFPGRLKPANAPHPQQPDRRSSGTSTAVRLRSPAPDLRTRAPLRGDAAYRRWRRSWRACPPAALHSAGGPGTYGLEISHRTPACGSATAAPWRHSSPDRFRLQMFRGEAVRGFAGWGPSG
jgi:hypothetical protein